MIWNYAGVVTNLSANDERVARLMRLWRLRSEVLAVAGYAAHHARTVVLRLVDARDHLVDQLLAAMGRLARL